MRRWSSSLTISSSIPGGRSDAARPLGFRVLAADDLPLDQELTIQDVQRVDAHVTERASGGTSVTGLRSTASISPRTDSEACGGERESVEVASQSDTRGNHLVRFGTDSFEPLPATVH